MTAVGQLMRQQLGPQRVKFRKRFNPAFIPAISKEFDPQVLIVEGAISLTVKSSTLSTLDSHVVFTHVRNRVRFLCDVIPIYTVRRAHETADANTKLSLQRESSNH